MCQAGRNASSNSWDPKRRHSPCDEVGVSRDDPGPGEDGKDIARGEFPEPCRFRQGKAGEAVRIFWYLAPQ